MSGLFVAAWRLVLKRAGADRLLVAAAFVTVLLAATLLAAGPIYSESVALSGLQRTLADAPVQERGLEISARVSAGNHRSSNGRAIRALETTLGSGSSIFRSALSDSFAVPREPGRPANALAVFAFYQGLASHARLVNGRWPRAERGLVEAVVPAAAARALGLAVGDDVVLAATADQTRTVGVRLVGTYRIADPDDVFWWASPLEIDGKQRVNFTRTDPSSFPKRLSTRRSRAGRARAGGQHWRSRSSPLGRSLACATDSRRWISGFSPVRKPRTTRSPAGSTPSWPRPTVRSSSPAPACSYPPSSWGSLPRRHCFSLPHSSRSGARSKPPSFAPAELAATRSRSSPSWRARSSQCPPLSLHRGSRLSRFAFSTRLVRLPPSTLTCTRA